jgi:protoheme ferro-lyase
MVVLLIILVITGLLIWGILEGVALFELGSPISDKDISDYLDKIESKNLVNRVSRRWNDKFVLDIIGWPNPSIYETQYSIIFPYYITDVGVIPIWSKSYSRVKKLFKDNIENSVYKTDKRKKLGLD